MLQCPENQLTLGIRDGCLTDGKYKFLRPQGGIADIRRQGAFFDPISFCKNDRAFGDITQLANIAWPRIYPEHRQRLIADTNNLEPVLYIELVDEMLHQKRNILYPRAQWRQR